eukprot:m.106292 g.106292  ORF g.106292 m.106292 type:complete len:495 (-) comp15297_c0_seq1:2211-3695(-)
MADNIGKRVQIGSHKGTIRFFGPVADTGEWYGVEWDDNSRGKHNGTHKGNRVFETKSTSETAASFIKPRKIEWGQDIVTAIKQRYTTGSLIDDSTTLHGVQVQLVGEAKVSNQLQDLSTLQEVVLRDCNVNDIVPQDLGVQLPALRALDLSNCLISQWTTIVEICRQLPLLESLIITQNVLPDDIGIEPEVLDSAFAGIKRFLACNMPLSLTTAVQLLTSMPQLEDLHLCELGWNTLQPLVEADLTRHLKLFNLYGNQISSWSQVFALAQSYHVEVLLANQNQLGDFEDAQVPTTLPLKALSIGGNRLQSWRCVWQLGRFKDLVDIKLRNNCLGQGLKESELRKCVLVNLPNVRVLNGSTVTARERLVADRFYLAHFATLYQTVEADAFHQLHPMYKQLVEKHGAVDAPVHVNHDSIRQRLLSLQVQYDDTQVNLFVCKDQTLREIIRTACLKLGLNVNYSHCHLARHGTVFEDVMKSAHFHNLQAGDQLVLTV